MEWVLSHPAKASLPLSDTVSMDKQAERRTEPRFEIDEHCTVTLLDRPDVSFSATLADLSCKGVCLKLDRQLPQASLVKIEAGDTLLLGEVVYSEPEADGFHVGVLLEHALYRTAELAAHAKRLLGDVAARRFSA